MGGEARMIGGDHEGAAADFARSMALATECGAPELAAASRAAEGKLALLPVDTRETTGPVGFTTRTDMAPAMATSSLIQAVREVAVGVG